MSKVHMSAFTTLRHYRKVLRARTRNVKTNRQMRHVLYVLDSTDEFHTSRNKLKRLISILPPSIIERVLSTLDSSSKRPYHAFPQ